jgi:diacylglycerol O-acyltransferase / wax synthase
VNAVAVAAGRHLSGPEALMWSLDDDPALRSTFISVSFLDQPVDLERFRARMWRAVKTVGVLRQRVIPTPFDLAPPRWEDDPDFDLDHHVRQITLPAPGGRRQLLELAAAVCAAPFDRSRPLWEFTLVDGLENGGGALLAKMHHVLSDGVGAIRVSASFLDVSPDGDLAEPWPASVRPAGVRSGGWLGAAAGTVVPILAANAGEVRRSAAAVAGGISSVVRAPGEGVALAWSTARSVVRQVGIADPARSPLWNGHDHQHRFETATLALESVKAAANKLDGTVNDAFVTILAAAAGAYHRARGIDVEELRISVPISVRRDHRAAGNAWVPSRVLVPTGDLSPAARFADVHRRLGEIKADPSLALAEGLASTLRHLPRPLLVRLARHQVGTVDFACSNVRGAPFDLWIAGSHVEANHPFGPTAGVAFNATVMSYLGSLDLGINVDTGAVEDPDDLRRCIEDAAAEFLS